MASGRRSRETARRMRKLRVRKNVRGSTGLPRLCVYRSLRYTYAQLVVDDTNQVLATASSRGATGSAKTVEAAKHVGVKIAELAKAKDISKIVFDRNGYRYHGRVAAVAAGAREGGLEF